MFANLLDNAAKYMAPGGTIRVTLAAADGEVRVRVHDEGYGTPPDRLEDLFELFTQVAEYQDDTSGGLGIGLSLARRIVEMHGGSIEASSAGVGRGSEFVVRLPECAAPARAAPPRRKKAAPGAPVRVLVVDDNVDAAEGLRQLLELHGHIAHTAYDGAAARARMSESPPDIVLLDLGLPAWRWRVGRAGCRAGRTC